MLLTIAAVYLLSIPFLQFFGALLLIWIAVKLLEQTMGVGGAAAERELPERRQNLSWSLMR